MKQQYKDLAEVIAGVVTKDLIFEYFHGKYKQLGLPNQYRARWDDALLDKYLMYKSYKYTRWEAKYHALSDIMAAAIDCFNNRNYRRFKNDLENDT